MSSRSFPAGTDFVDVGSATSIDDIDVGTIWAWVRTPAGAANGTIFGKGSQSVFRMTAAGVARLNCTRTRATTTMEALADVPAVGSSEWVFLAAVWDTAGANGDQKLYGGDLTTIVAEAGAYTTQQVGTGAPSSNAASNGRIGVSSAGTQPFTGRIAVVGLISGRRLSLGELQSLQFRPRVVAGTVGLWWPGHDNGTTVPDLSGNLNNGTLNGASTVQAGAPLADALWGGVYQEDIAAAVAGGAPDPRAVQRTLRQRSVWATARKGTLARMQYAVGARPTQTLSPIAGSGAGTITYPPSSGERRKSTSSMARRFARRR